MTRTLERSTGRRAGARSFGDLLTEPARHLTGATAAILGVAVAHAAGTVASLQGWRVPAVGDPLHLLEATEFGGFLAALVLTLKVRPSSGNGTTTSNVDTLTGLPGWVAFEEAFDAEMPAHGRGASHPVSVLFVDLDDLKAINYSLGYRVGDEVLVEVGRRLQQHVAGAGLVCRLGGSEFAVLSPRMDRQAASALAESIQDAFHVAVVTPSQQRLSVSLNIGVAVYPHHGRDAFSVLACASDASRVAKQTGRNAVRMLEIADLVRHREDAELQVELRTALGLQQFVLHYQPIVDLDTGYIAGAEALVRWAHPERGMIRAGDFIELAEREGLMPEIGEWILREALEQAGDWIRRIDGFQVAVSISGTQLRSADFGNRLADLLGASGVAAERLVLELGDRSQLSDGGDEIAALRAISAQGVGLLIDDSSYGYSVMKYLDVVPLTAIKLDQSSIARATAGRHDRLIVETLIGLAHGLGLRVLADGVEASDQLEFLSEAGCDLYRGHPYRVQLDAPAFDALLRARVPMAA